MDPDGTQAYCVDSPIGVVDRFARSPGAGLGERRPFARIERPGQPDGLTVDAVGGVWVAVWGAGEARRYTPDGRLSEVVTVPARQVTALALAGPDLDELFITSSRHGLLRANCEPHWSGGERTSRTFR